MVISEVVCSFYLAFSYEGIDEITKLRSEKKAHVLSLIRILTWIFILINCQGQTLLYLQCYWLPVLLCLYSFYVYIEAETVWGGLFGIFRTVSYKRVE